MLMTINLKGRYRAKPYKPWACLPGFTQVWLGLPLLKNLATPLLEPDCSIAINLKRALMFEGITETGAEKFVVHIHVNLARKQ